MISRPKARNQFLLLVLKSKQDCSCCAKKLALTLWWKLTNKISGTEYHHKLIFYSSCHVPRRVLGGATKVEPETIRVGNERLLAITGDLITTTVTQRATRCHYRWYLFLFHWIIWSSIHISCPRFVNSHPGLHLTVLVITNALIAITLTQRAMSWINEWIIPWRKHRYHRWLQRIALWVNVISIKAFFITRTVRWKPGWLLKNRGQLRWIDDLIIQWKRNRYHR